MSETRAQQFPETEWTMVLAAGSDASIAQPALERLCRKYWWPLFGAARRAGLSKEASEDLVQGYLHSVIERGSLSHIERGKGRFRSWLLGGLEHVMLNQYRHDTAKKRSDGKQLFALDDMTLELPAFPGASPSEAFDRHWAQTIMKSAVNRLREEQIAAGKTAVYAHLEPIITGQDRTSYATLATRVNTTEKNVALTVFRLRSRLRDILRAEVAETVTSSEALEEEMSYLLRLLLEV